MGLRRKQGANPQEGEQFDIRMTVEDFKRDVYAYSFWQPTMWINVCHVKRKDIPSFVFPGGFRPSPPPRSSESRSLQRSLGSNPPHFDAATSRKKRKQNGVSTGISLTESSSNGACISDATSFDQTMKIKQIETDLRALTNNGRSPETISLHGPEAGPGQSKYAEGPPSFSSGAVLGSLGSEKHVAEQSSAQIIIKQEGFSDVVDGPVVDVELKNGIEQNGETEGIEVSESLTVGQSVEVATAGNETSCLSIQQKADLEELEVLSAYFSLASISMHISVCSYVYILGGPIYLFYSASVKLHLLLLQFFMFEGAACSLCIHSFRFLGKWCI